MKKVILKILKFYKRVPFLGHSGCKFIPTCSDYTCQAVDKYGVTRGLWLGLLRILRCNPFNKGGVDLLQ